jgi:hypothetical protein
MFENGSDGKKERSAQAGDILVYWLDDGVFSVTTRDPQRPGKISIGSNDDKLYFPLAGTKNQVRRTCHAIARLFALAVCCDAIPYKMSESTNSSLLRTFFQIFSPEKYYVDNPYAFVRSLCNLGNINDVDTGKIIISSNIVRIIGYNLLCIGCRGYFALETRRS